VEGGQHGARGRRRAAGIDDGAEGPAEGPPSPTYLATCLAVVGRQWACAVVRQCGTLHLPKWSAESGELNEVGTDPALPHQRPALVGEWHEPGERITAVASDLVRILNRGRRCYS